jgi:hypothetical protein
MEKTNKASEITLVPIETLKRAAKKIFSNTKKESDRELAKFQPRILVSDKQNRNADSFTHTNTSQGLRCVEYVVTRVS